MSLGRAKEKEMEKGGKKPGLFEAKPEVSEALHSSRRVNKCDGGEGGE